MNEEQTRYGSPLRTGPGELQSAFRFPVRMPASPTDTPPHDVLVVAAESAFAFVNRPGREWARELLFSGLGDDIAGDVAALSNVDAFALGEMAEFVVASTPASRGGTRDGAVPVPGSEPPEDSGAPETATHSRFLWIPALVHDGITAGMVVHRVDFCEPSAAGRAWDVSRWSVCSGRALRRDFGFVESVCAWSRRAADGYGSVLEVQDELASAPHVYAVRCEASGEDKPGAAAFCGDLCVCGCQRHRL
jgi:hypothetical protein